MRKTWGEVDDDDGNVDVDVDVDYHVDDVEVFEDDEDDY